MATTTNPRTADRQGIVLLVVLALLALFSSVALTFVFYAESQATAAQILADSQGNVATSDLAPETLLSYFMSQYIYGTNDPASSLRGHDLARSIYGYNPMRAPKAPISGNPAISDPGQMMPNLTPFNGAGRLRTKRPVTVYDAKGLPSTPQLNLDMSGPTNRFLYDGYSWINYQKHPADKFYRDPEFNGAVGEDLSNPPNPWRPDPDFAYVGGHNVPWTAADMNNLFLAVIDTNGDVVLPSFYRPWTKMVWAWDNVNKYFTWQDLNPPAQAWLPQYRKYMTLSPEDWWNWDPSDPTRTDPKKSFNYQLVDADAGGHVRNLEGSRGLRLKPDGTGGYVYAQNDSFWIDLNFPIMVAPNGKKFKPLFAPLVIDLDGRVNLWLSGNHKGSAHFPGIVPTPHLSHKGIGPGDINTLHVNIDPTTPLPATSDFANLMKARFPGQAPVAPWPPGPNFVNSNAHFGSFVDAVDRFDPTNRNGTYTMKVLGTAHRPGTPYSRPEFDGLIGGGSKESFGQKPNIADIGLPVTPVGLPLPPGPSHKAAPYVAPWFFPLFPTYRTQTATNTYDWDHLMTNTSGVNPLPPPIAGASDDLSFNVSSFDPYMSKPRGVINQTPILPATNMEPLLRPEAQGHSGAATDLLNLISNSMKSSLLSTVQIPPPGMTGTGYTVGNILTLAGGAGSQPAQLTVTGVDPKTGAITSVIVGQAGRYTTTPPNPVFATGGSGINAAFFAYWSNSRHLVGVANWQLDQTAGVPWLLATDPAYTYALPTPVATGATTVSQGSGYTIGDILQVGGGIPSAPGQETRLQVSTVGAGGIITGVIINNAGNYTVRPTNSVQVSGGTGTGASFNISWSVYPKITGSGGTSIDFSTPAPAAARAPNDYNYATVTAAAIVNGGTKYAVNDLMQVIGGIHHVGQAVILKVTAVGMGGAVTGVQIVQSGKYTGTPATPTSVASATGMGALFALVWTTDYRFDPRPADLTTPNTLVMPAATSSSMPPGNLPRLDLDRKLTRYPSDPGYPQNNPADPTRDATVGAYYDTTTREMNWTSTFLPPAGPPTNMIVQNIYRQAVIDRQVFARDVFHYLLHATGARNPNDLLADPSITPITPVQYAAAKYLAQLAVNIVDYIDSDDYITAFPWDQASTPGTPLYLFGTEMPNLVINEVYAQQDNDSNEATLQGKGKGKGKGKGGNSATDYHLNFWVELVNPHNASAGWPSAPYPVDKGTTYLSNNSHDIYKVMVWAKRPELVFPDPVSDPSGVTPLCIVGNSGNNAKGGIEWPAAAGQNSVAPLNGAFSGPTAGNTGFYLLGPSVTNGYLTMRDPGFPAKGFATHNAPAAVKKGNLSDYHNVMSVIIDADDLDNNPKVTFSSVTVVLRRLACPHAPYDPNPVAGKMPNPFYNPYITVDVFDDIRLQANHDYDANGATKGSTPTADLKALGRIQPFQASNPVHTWATPTAPIVPHHTFFRHNSNYDFSTNPPAGWPAIDTATAPAVPSLKVPFDWLVHLDRPVINPIELLHVSAYPPDQLTTQFYNGGTLAPTQPLLMQFGDSTNHNAPWMTEASLLYRFLGFAATPSALSNAIVGGRVPGKININTTYRECIRAILDYDARFTGGSGWTTQFADQIATNILNRRGYDTATMSMFDAAGNHRWTADPLPIMPFTSGLITGGDKQFPSGLGINHTLLAQRLVGTGPGIMPVFDPSFTLPATPPPPYAQSQYLQKAFNNLTTTSNCYALWLTVGFFEVIDDTVQPAKLGAELGRSQNRHIRHRFFSIIDRSDLTILRDTVSAAINVDSPANWNTGTASASTALLIDPQGLNDNSQILPQRFLFTLAGNAVPNFVDDLTVEILDPATGVHELAKAKVYYANASVPTNGVNPKTLSPLVKAVPGIYPTAQSPMLKVELFNSYGPGAIVTLRGNPGPQPMTYTALTAAPVAASATVPKLVPSTVPVRGPLTNKMVGQLVTVGPDPVTGLKEHAVLQDLRTESGFSATGPQLVLFLTNAYNANTPISWTDPTVYSVRHDRAVVPHYNIME